MRKFTTRALLLGLVFCVFSSAQAQDMNFNAPKKVVQAFFEAIAESRIDQAISELFQGSQMLGDQPQIAAYKKNIGDMIKVFGPVRRADQVGLKSFGPMLVRLDYVVSHNLHPMFWRVVLYQSIEGWVVISVEFKDDPTIFKD